MKNKLPSILIAFGIAVALWLYVVTVVSPNSDKHYHNIPVTIQSEVILQERGFMITTTELPTVSLHLEGNRTDLNKLNSSNITVSADVSRIGEPGTHTLPLTPVFPGDVPNNAITVLSRDPGSITITVEQRITKEVPVAIQYVGTLSEDYMADKENKELDYQNITISGPKSAIDQITMARIDVDMTNRTESISEAFRFILCDAAGEPVDAALVTANTDAVTLTLKILQVKEIDLVVTVVNGGGANDKTSEITISPSSIRVSGSTSLLEGLDKLELATLNLAEISGDQTLTFPIKLPEGVTNETGLQEATVEIRFPELSTKVLTVTKINAINIPQGLTADLITQRLEIQVRGPKSKVQKIAASDISVTVDLSNEQVGTATVRADIAISAEGVGAVGIYDVTATLRKG